MSYLKEQAEKLLYLFVLLLNVEWSSLTFPQFVFFLLILVFDPICS